MSFDKMWSNYVLHTLDAQKLDQMILNLNCQILGCRTGNKKSLKGIHQSIKIGALNKRLFIEQEVREEVAKLYESLLEKDELQQYYKMTASEFIKQINSFKQEESKDAQLVVVNYFLQAADTLDAEKEQIVKYFTIDKKASRNISENKIVVKVPVVESVDNLIMAEKEHN